MTSPTAFWDKAAPKYAESTISDIDGYQETLARTISHLSPTDRVLELGCGTASTALQVAPHVTHLTASDISPAMIEIGREKLWNSGQSNVTLMAGSVTDSVLQDGAPYDAILALNLLHLLPEQSQALARMHELLAPGGLLISKTGCLGGKWYLRALIGVMRLIGKAPYVAYQTQAALRSAIVDAGFEVVEEVNQSGMVPRLYLVARKV